MSRLSRFEDYRFVGTRDTMTVFDCDDPEQLSTLSSAIEDHDLVSLNLLQSFAPDTLDEARSRGFRPFS